MAAARLDSKLEAKGAEFLVLGNLLIEGIEAHEAYRNAPGCDLIATSPKSGSACRIQVKSRWAPDANGFIINNLDSDFVIYVYVALNRGKGAGKGGRALRLARLSPDMDR
jgi:hypothetical protein